MFSVLIILPAIYSLIVPGYFGVHDDMHPAWVFEMFKAFSLKQFPPRWAPDLSFGFGYPLFHFIYPLPYYLGAIFYWLGMSLTGSVEMVHVLALVFSGVFMYLLAREFWDKKASLMAGILYVYTPYRAVDIYVRGALGEAVAFVFLPLIAWGIIKIKKTGYWYYSSITSLAVAGLILSHNLTAIIGLPILIVYSLLNIWEKRKTPKVKILIFQQIFAYIFGLIISAYFWLPALVDKKMMVEDSVFNFVDHFPFIKQLIFSKWGYGASLWGPDDGMSFQVGIVNWIVLFASGFFLLNNLIKKRKNKIGTWYFLLVAGVSLFLMNIRSLFLWNSIPLLAYFQFPWRLLIITTFCSSFLAGFVASKIKVTKWLMVIMLMAPIVSTVNYFKPEKVKYISDEQIFNRFFAVNPVNPEKESKEYLTLTEEYLRLPKNTKIRPDKYVWDKFVLEKPQATKIEVKKNSAIDYKIETSGEKNLLTGSIYALSGWKVKMDGKLTEIGVGEPYGQIEVEIPAGRHHIEVLYRQTEFWQVVNIVSLGGLMVVGWLIVRGKDRGDLYRFPPTRE